MKQKGMAIVMAILLAAGAAAPVCAEEIYSFEAVYAGSQQSSPPAQQREESSPQPQMQQKEEVRQPVKKKIRIVKKAEIAENNVPVIAQSLPEKPEQDSSDFPYTLESFAEEILRLTNEARAEAGASPLEPDPTLNEMAQARKDENKGKMTHIRPDGTTADTIFKEYDTSLKCTGEIIMSVSRSPQAVVDGFLASKSHRENLLSPSHRYVGIGVSWGETPAGTGIAVLELFAK